MIFSNSLFLWVKTPSFEAIVFLAAGIFAYQQGYFNREIADFEYSSDSSKNYFSETEDGKEEHKALLTLLNKENNYQN